MSVPLPELQDLTSAEEFLDHFAIPFDREAIHPVRTSMLRLFRQYLAAATLPEADEARHSALRDCLARALNDALTTARQPTQAPQPAPVTTFIPLSAVSDGIARPELSQPDRA